MGAMSQVLGKPQPEDEDDDEEDELVGLADYADGPDSSDADPDSGAEEGGERGVPRPAPRPGTISLPSVSSSPPPDQARGPPTWRGSKRAELRGGSGEGRQKSDHGLQNGGSRVRAVEGGPDPWREERGSVRAGGTYPLWPLPGLVHPLPLTRSSPLGLGVGNGRGPPGAPWDLSLNAAVEAWSDVVAKKGSRRQRDWQGRRQLRVSVLPRVAAGGVLRLHGLRRRGHPWSRGWGGVRA